MALTHHDPTRNDDAVDRIVAALHQGDEQKAPSMEVFAAAEGQVLELHADATGKRAHPLHEVSAVAPVDSALVRQSVLLGIADLATAGPLLEALRADGIRTMFAADGDSALRKALEDHPSLAILERILPGIDGPSVCGMIRSRSEVEEFAGRIPIVILSDREDSKCGTSTEGVTDWLIKPFTTSYARTRVRALLMGIACRWKRPRIPKDEEQRLAALRALRVLDTPPEKRFDCITRLAAAAFDVPIALVSLVDRDRQWFKSAHGLGVRETSRESSFCGLVIASRNPMVVADALLDDRFADNPLVTAGPRVRFYAGQPLILPDGSCVGALCLIDTRPRQLDDKDLDLLSDIGVLVLRELLQAPAMVHAMESTT